MLTKEHIEQLFAFCKKHYVHYYDVQVELVDHMANAIEARMAADKQLPFETALDIVYAGFGFKGFASIVNSRSLALSKQYAKLKKQLFLSYFTWPKVAMTACLFLILSFLPKFLTGDRLFYSPVILMFCLIMFEIYVSWQVNHFRKKQNQKLLITEVRPEAFFFNAALVPQLMMLFMKHSDFAKDPKTGFIIYYVFIIVMILFFVGTLAYKELAKKIHQLAMEQYPEVFVVA